MVFCSVDKISSFARPSVHLSTLEDLILETLPVHFQPQQTRCGGSRKSSRWCPPCSWGTDVSSWVVRCSHQRRLCMNTPRTTNSFHRRLTPPPTASPRAPPTLPASDSRPAMATSGPTAQLPSYKSTLPRPSAWLQGHHHRNTGPPSVDPLHPAWEGFFVIFFSFMLSGIHL